MRRLILVCLLIGMANPVQSQKLPDGRINTIRDRTYDLLHLRAEIAIDPDLKTVEGVVTIRLQPLRRIENVVLDAWNLEVEQVVLEGQGVVSHDSGSRHLSIPLPESAEPGQEIVFRVRYRVSRPRAGMYFLPDSQNPGRVFAFTYGEGGLHANWIPSYNDVNDPFTSEMVVTVPAPYVVVSNGTQQQVRKGPEGHRTFHWKQDR